MNVRELTCRDDRRHGDGSIVFALGLMAALVAGSAHGQEAAPAAPAAVASGRVLTLEEAVSRAAGVSPERAEAQADVDESVAHRKGKLAGVGPKVRANFDQIAFDRPVQVDFGGAAFTLRPDLLREGSIEVVQPVVGVYTQYKEAAAASAHEQASLAHLEAASSTAAFTAADAYLEAQEAEEMERIVAASVAAADSQVKDADAIAKSGRLSRSDVLKIGIAAQDARAARAKAVARKRKALDRLYYVTGLPADAAVRLDPIASAEAVQSVPTPSRETAISATAGRLDLKVASANVDAATRDEDAKRWKLAPSVDVFAKWDRVYSEPPFGTPPFTRSYGVVASWEIWDNGSRVYETQESAAKAQKAATALNEARDRSRLEVDGIFADQEAAKEALAAAKASVEQAEEAYRLDSARFGNGLVTTTDLLLSEATRTKARGTLASAVTQVRRLTFALQRATGASKPQ